MHFRPFLVPVLAASLWLTGCAGKTPPQEPVMPPPPYSEGRLVLPDGTAVDMEAFLGLTKDVHFILVGEVHDNPAHHQMQAALLTALARDGRRPLLGMEMIQADRQKRLAGFNAGRVSTDALPELLDWKNTWGFDFALYRPLFAAAREGRIPVFGLNAPQRVVKAVQKSGLAGVPAGDRRWLPKHLLPPPEEQRRALEAVFQRHAAMRAQAPAQAQQASLRDTGAGAPAGDAFERFLLIQSLWDSTMAEQALAVQKRLGRPMLIAAGLGHVEYGYGIAHRLRTLAPNARVVLVLPFAQDAPAPGAGDLFFYAAHRAKTRLGLLLKATDQGLLIEAVAPSSPAQKAGLMPGDVVIEVSGTPVRTMAEMHMAAMKAKGLGNEGTVLRILRQGRELDFTLPAAKARPAKADRAKTT